MSFDVEYNFIISTNIGYGSEVGEEGRCVSFQIQVAQLFDEEELFANQLIPCSSGIKTEFKMRNYVVNGNLGYYNHEIISKDRFSVRTINNNITRDMQFGCDRVAKNISNTGKDLSQSKSILDDGSTLGTLNMKQSAPALLGQDHSTETESGQEFEDAPQLTSVPSAKDALGQSTILQAEELLNTVENNSNAFLGQSSNTDLRNKKLSNRYIDEQNRASPLLIESDDSEDDPVSRIDISHPVSKPGDYLYPILERKTNEYRNPYMELDIERLWMGLDALPSHLTNPIQANSPRVLRQSSSIKPPRPLSKNSQRRSNSFDQSSFLKNLPANTKKLPLIKHSEPKQPQPPQVHKKPAFTRKLAKIEPVSSELPPNKRGVSKVSDSPSVPTSGTPGYRRPRGLIRNSALKDTSTTTATPAFSPSSRDNDESWRQAAQSTNINFEDPKNLAPSLRRRPDLEQLKLPPTKASTQSRVSRSTPRSSIRGALSATKDKEKETDSRRRYITPLKTRNINGTAAEESKIADSSIDSYNQSMLMASRMTTKLPTHSHFHNVSINAISVADSMRSTRTKFPPKRFQNAAQRDSWINIEDLRSKMAQQETKGGKGFDAYLAKFTADYTQDINKLMGGFKASIKNENLLASKPSELLQRQSQQASSDLKASTQTTNRSKIPYAAHNQSYNPTILENLEKDNEEDMYANADWEEDDEAAEERQSQRLPSEQRQPMSRSLSRKREDLNITKQLDQKLNSDNKKVFLLDL